MTFADPLELNRLRAIEAIASAWASIDGKTERFYACKADPQLDRLEGRYSGYLADASSLLNRIERRGFTIWPNGILPDPEEPTP